MGKFKCSLIVRYSLIMIFVLLSLPAVVSAQSSLVQKLSGLDAFDPRKINLNQVSLTQFSVSASVDDLSNKDKIKSKIQISYWPVGCEDCVQLSVIDNHSELKRSSGATVSWRSLKPGHTYSARAIRFDDRTTRRIQTIWLHQP